MNTRPANLVEKSNPSRSVALGFVDLNAKGHTRAKPGESYQLVSAGSDSVGELPVPATTYKRLDLDLRAFYSADLPDIWGANEGLLKIRVYTKKPQAIDESPAAASFATDFSVEDSAYAPTFLYRGVFRNVLIADRANIGFDLYEIDSDAGEYYDKIKSVISGVPEIKNLDVLDGIPYLNLATNLFEGIVKTFGVNPDDHLWGEIPILEVNPLIGGAFLRSGIYVLFEPSEDGEFDDLGYMTFKNGQVQSERALGNHLVFALQVRSHSTT